MSAQLTDNISNIEMSWRSKIKKKKLESKYIDEVSNLDNSCLSF